MTKLIVNNKQSVQELITVGRGGGYNDLDRVLYDERIDGPLDPAIEAQVGGLTKEPDGSLSFDQAKKDAQDAAEAAKEAEKAAKEAAKDKAKQDLKDDFVNLTTKEQVEKIAIILGLIDPPVVP